MKDEPNKSEASPRRTPSDGADLSVLRGFTERERFEAGASRYADQLPASFVSQPVAYARLLDFERDVGARPEFAAVARYTQVIARAS